MQSYSAVQAYNKSQLDALNAAVAAYENCATAYLQEDDVQALTRCIALTRDCADVCALTLCLASWPATRRTPRTCTQRAPKSAPPAPTSSASTSTCIASSAPRPAAAVPKGLQGINYSFDLQLLDFHLP